MKILNRFGEVHYEKNEAIVTMPFNRLSLEEPEILEENYVNKIKEIGYPDTFIYADHFSSIRDRLQISYDLDGCVDFHQIHKYKLKDMIPFLKSMVDLAKQDVAVLWQKENMVIDLTEQRVKALIFNFEGFKIYKQDNAVDGLKELILLALTNKKSIIAKPKRADFIEKTNEVYQFSDDILACNTVEDIDGAIQAYKREVDYQALLDEQAKAEKREKSKLFAIKEKLTPKKKKTNPDEQMKQALKEQAGTKEGKNKSSGNLLDKLTTPTSMLTIIGVIGVFGFLIATTDLTTGASSEEDEVQKELSQKEDVLEAYRLYISGNEEDIDRAYAKLDAIGYSNLPKKDQATLIDWYIQQEQYTKAMTLEPGSDVKIADTIKESHKDNPDAIKSELETLQTSFEDSDVLKFDLANMEDNYQGMVESSHLTNFDENRANLAVKAFVLTNQVDELDKLIDDYKENEESYEMLQSQYDRYVDQYTSEREAFEELEKRNKRLEWEGKDLSDEKDKDKKKDLKSDIKDIKKDIDKKKEEINKIKEKIKND